MARGRKTGGRRRGSLNKAIVEAREACAELVDDPEYRRRLGERLRGGELSPAVECMLCITRRAGPKTKSSQRSTSSSPGKGPSGRDVRVPQSDLALDEAV
jgi:hypothetical protein